MKIIVIDTDYEEHIESSYRKYPNLSSLPYKEQKELLELENSGPALPCVRALNSLGHTAELIIVNNERLQKAWVKEHGAEKMKMIPALLKKLEWRLRKWGWQEEILEAQIRSYKPDVIYSITRDLDTGFNRRIKKLVKLYILQIASKLPKIESFDPFDFVVSSLPNQVEYLKAHGKKSYYLKLAFDQRILEKLETGPVRYDVTHIGGYDQIHIERNRTLEAVAKELRLDTWGYSIESLSPESAIRKNYHGEAWGSDMFSILRSSKMTITGHVRKVAGEYSNNMRMYEATGVGCLLLVDNKKNIGDIFIPGKEVVTYDSPEDLVKKIKYYLSHEEERAAIAAAGQKRTLSEHTYEHRMKELVNLINNSI